MSRTEPQPELSAALPRVRIDKWLWASRFYKTRAIAAQAVENGQVRLNEVRVKPGHVVRAGDRISVNKQGLAWEVEVTAVAERRGSATEAAKLFREDAQSAAARQELVRARTEAAALAPRFPGRPTKRQRRKLEDFLSEP